jgi:tetratricopeptide (TPR) repeat protein
VTRPPSTPIDVPSIGLFDRWAPRLILLTIVIIPWIFCLDMEDSFDLPKLTWVYVLDGVLAGLWAIQALAQKKICWQRTAFDFPLMVFLIAAGVSTFFSLDRQLSLFGAYKIYVFGVLPMTAFAALFWFSAQAWSESLMKRAQMAALIGALGVTAYAFLQYTGNEIFQRMPAVVGGRVWSSLGNPLYMGAVCMMALPLITDVLLRRSRTTLWAAVWPGIFFLTLVGGMALSLSRSAWLGSLLSIGVMLWVYRADLKRLVPVVAGLMLGILFIGLLPGVRERVSVMFAMHEGSNASRIAGWKAGVQVFKAHPVVGSGPDTFFQAFRPHRDLTYVRATGAYTTQGDAHNDAIQIAATQGALGLAAALWILFAFFKTFTSIIASPTRAAWAAAIIALLIQNLFNFSSVATTAWAAVFAAFMSSGTRPVDRPVTPAGRAILIGLLIVCPVAVWVSFWPLCADLAYKEGLTLMQQNQSMRALPALQKAVQLQGRHELYQTQLTNAFKDLAGLSADPAQKERYYDQAWMIADAETRRHPNNPDPWNNRGVAAMWMIQMAQRDVWQDARASFERATQLDPMFVDAWANLAKWEHLSGHLDKEKEYWKVVLQIDPAHPMALAVLQPVR